MRDVGEAKVVKSLLTGVGAASHKLLSKHVQDMPDPLTRALMEEVGGKYDDFSHRVVIEAWTEKAAMVVISNS